LPGWRKWQDSFLLLFVSSPSRQIVFGSLSVPLEAGFGEVDVVLDAAEDFVVDGVFVTEGDNGVAFYFQGFTGYEAFIMSDKRAKTARY
jgi:hypothetical protein